MKKRREAWRRVQPWIDPARLVFLDETGFTTKMTRLYGRCLARDKNAFAKPKTLIRGAAERTIDGLQNSIGKALDAFSRTECANYFRHAGYA